MHHARAAAADPDRSAIGGAESQQAARLLDDSEAGQVAPNLGKPVVGQHAVRQIVVSVSVVPDAGVVARATRVVHHAAGLIHRADARRPVARQQTSGNESVVFDAHHAAPVVADHDLGLAAHVIPFVQRLDPRGAAHHQGGQRIGR